MTSIDTERLKDQLLAKQKELSTLLGSRDEIVVEKSSDPLDEVQLMVERDFAVRNLDRSSQMLRHIGRALSRMADGTYGICLHCDDRISPRRIAAVPWTTSCLSCQEKIDRREIDVDEGDNYFSSAA